MEQDTVKNLINVFLQPPSGKTPTAIRERLTYWIERANHPDLYTEDKSKLAVNDLRRRAKQNLKRTIERYPEVATQFARDIAQPETAE